jgi:prophage regulatory protein
MTAIPTRGVVIEADTPSFMDMRYRDIQTTARGLTRFPISSQAKPPTTPKALPAFYRLRDVVRISSLSRSTIYRRIAEGRFPPPVSLGGRASGWPSAALHQWAEDPQNYRCSPSPEPEVK